jgi:hypothetical protein
MNMVKTQKKILMRYLCNRRKIMLRFILAIFAISILTVGHAYLESSAQAMNVLTEIEEAGNTVSISAEGTSKSDLFAIASMWMSNMFSGSESVIEIADIENGIVIGNQMFTIGSGAYQTNVNNKIVIQVMDNEMMITFSDLATQSVVQAVAGETLQEPINQASRDIDKNLARGNLRGTGIRDSIQQAGTTLAVAAVADVTVALNQSQEEEILDTWNAMTSGLRAAVQSESSNYR